MQTRVYTTGDGRAVIEQSGNAVVTLSSDEILKVIDELRACYDWCAAWKMSTPKPDGAVSSEVQS